jgi:hypothetical protein
MNNEMCRNVDEREIVKFEQTLNCDNWIYCVCVEGDVC